MSTELLKSVPPSVFGYEKGAFSGAVARKIGLLQLADGGTLFLDEVGTISPMMQVKLLRFLQDRTLLGHFPVFIDFKNFKNWEVSLIPSNTLIPFRLYDIRIRIYLFAHNSPDSRQCITYCSFRCFFGKMKASF